MRRQGAPFGQQRTGAAISEVVGAARPAIGHSQHCPAKRAGDEDRVACTRAAPVGDGRVRGPADSGAAPYAASIGAHRVAAQQRGGIGLEHLPEARDEAFVGVAQHMRNQHPDGGGALGGKIGQVHRHQLPRDVGRVLVLADMDALDQRIVCQDKLFAADLDNRGIIVEAARGGCVGQRPQRGDECAFVQRPASLATASRMPLTNFASRSSKNALATSTYSLIELALGTSGRAISS